MRNSVLAAPLRAMPPRGVTLLEVLFAIGVVAVGVLGVAALVPVALYQAGKGNTADRSATLAERSVRDFHIQKMGKPARWYLGTGAPVVNPLLMSTPPFLVTDLPFSVNLASPYQYVHRGGAFAIDPRFVSINRQVATGPFNANWFPYYSGAVTDPRMNRINLADGFQETASLATALMSAATAERVFVASDDLVFDLPADRSQPPAAKYSMSPGRDGAWGVANTDDDGNGITDDSSEFLWSGSDDYYKRRESDGAYSWLATLVPRRDQFGATRDEYVLSIVILQGRSSALGPGPDNQWGTAGTDDDNNGIVDDISEAAWPQTDDLSSLSMFRDENANGAYDTGEPTTGLERLVNVVAFPGNGVGGGDVVLEARSSAISPVEDLQVKEGDWLMLGRSLQTPPPPATIVSMVSTFQWYKVVGVEDIDTSTNPLRRTVTLQGPDWEPALPGSTPTEATLMPNVVIVYERLIRLDLSSLF